MNQKVLNLYCDESCHLENDGKSIFGVAYISCPIDEVRYHNLAIRSLAQEYCRLGDIKWTKISTSNISFHLAIMDYFFSQKNLNFRALIMEKAIDFRTIGADLSYYNAMLELISPTTNRDVPRNVYLDRKDTLGAVQILRLQANFVSRSSNILKVQEIRSKEVALMQVADLFLGAVVRAKRDENVTSSAKRQFISQLSEKYGVEIHKDVFQDISKFEIIKLTLQNESTM